MTLADLDGRSSAALFIKAVTEAVHADLGGGDRLSETQRLAVSQLALLCAMFNDQATRWLKGGDVPPETLATLSNSFRRLASDLGWDRQMKDATPTLAAYLKQRSVINDDSTPADASGEDNAERHADA